MKKFIIAIFIAGSFLGCGGGGSGGAVMPTGPILAEATTENGLKAYDAMSVATYLPSLYVNLYPQINNGGVDINYSCANNGSINVKFVDIPNAKEEDGTLLFLYSGSYEFDMCQLDSGGTEVLLDGKIISYSHSMSAIGNTITGYIKSGFRFLIKDDVSLIYGSFPFKDKAKLITEFFNDDGKGSFFTVMHANSGAKIISNHAKYKEVTLGDITYTGSFTNTLLMAGVNENQKGIIASAPTDDMINWLIPLDSSDYWDKLLIYINPNEYFETDYNSVSSDELKTILTGRNDKNVTVWQDKSEAVHAETENTADISYTAHTPSF